jgi:hypothetical protein
MSLRMLDKVRAGVLQLSTPNGSVCVKPPLKERLLLLWIFRNFKILPEQVLGEGEKKLINRLRDSDLTALPGNFGKDEGLVIGTVDYEFMKKPVQSERRVPTPTLVQPKSNVSLAPSKLAIVHRKEA